MRAVQIAILACITTATAGFLAGDARSAGELQIDELRVPSSPAFTMLGVSPTAVERPSTPRALGLSLLSATERSGSGIPNDLALEFAPYWWKSHPDLTFDNYYDKDKKFLDTIKQTLAISLGTTDLEDQAGVSGSRAAIGLRFMLHQGVKDPALDERVKDLREAQVRLLDCVPDEPTEPVDEGCVSVAEREIRTQLARVKDKTERMGWIVEFAAAATRDFADNDAEQAGNTRFGGWFTASYHFKKVKTDGTEMSSPLTVVAVARYLSKDDATLANGSEDVGGRLIWKGESDAGMPPLAISIEGLRRFAEQGDDSSRIVAVLEYRLPVENLSIVASYGKDFKDLTGHDSMVTTLGINFGLGKGPIVP